MTPLLPIEEIIRTRALSTEPLRVEPVDRSLTLSGAVDNARKRLAGCEAGGASSVVFNPAAPNNYYPLYGGHLDGIDLPEFDFGEYIRVIKTTMNAMGG